MIEKILIEINRLKNELDGYSAREALDYIESYINTLSKQQVEEPVSDDLEEAAEEYLQKVKAGFLRTLEHPTAKDCFKAGAEWQKEQMMKEAVEYEVGMHGEPIKITLDKYVQRARGIFPGDKIKIIIIKED